MTGKSGMPCDDLSLPLAGLFVLTLVGGLLAIRLVREVRANFCYVEGRCVLLDKRLFEHRGGGSYRPEFLIHYSVAGREYEAWTYDAVRATTIVRWPKERVLEWFTVGQKYPCWYDPADPSQVVLVRGYGWWTYGLLTVFVVLAFLTGKGFLRGLRGARRAADAASRVRPGARAPCDRT
jgi:hypothetical protein